MACSAHHDSAAEDAGFATPAATVICLALALGVASAMTYAVTAQRAATGHWRRTQAEFALAGARLLATETLLQSASGDRFRWTIPVGGAAVEVVAESEAAKLSLAQAEQHAEGLSEMLRAGSASEVARALSSDVSDPDARDVDVTMADAAPDWSRCASSYVSPWGQAADLTATPPEAPRPGPGNWRVGQLWRLRLSGADGWVEDSVVRFTGDARHPIAVVVRRFNKTGPMGDRCDFIAQDMPAR